jgi:general secretion pathway protein F
MPVYAYKGLNASGRSVGGIIDADSAKTARIKLRRTGVYPTELNEQRAETRDLAVAQLRRQPAVQARRAQDLALMTATVDAGRAGLPLVECLTALVERVDARGEHSLQVREKVVEGGTWPTRRNIRASSASLRQHGRAGEASGALDVVLRLADCRAFRRVAQQVRNALTIHRWPWWAAAFCSCSYVVPKSKIFEGHPPEAAGDDDLLAVSSFAQRYWWLIVAFVLAIVGVRVSRRTPGQLR